MSDCAWQTGCSYSGSRLMTFSHSPGSLHKTIISRSSSTSLIGSRRETTTTPAIFSPAAIRSAAWPGIVRWSCVMISRPSFAAQTSNSGSGASLRPASRAVMAFRLGMRCWSPRRMSWSRSWSMRSRSIISYSDVVGPSDCWRADQRASSRSRSSVILFWCFGSDSIRCRRASPSTSCCRRYASTS
jgi:hypothetical protein